MVRKLNPHFSAFFVNFYQINMSASWPTVGGGGPHLGKIPTFFFLATPLTWPFLLFLAIFVCFFRDNFPINSVTCWSSSTTLGFIFSFFLLFSLYDIFFPFTNQFSRWGYVPSEVCINLWQGVRMSLGTSLMKHESESGQTVLEKVNDDDSDAGEILTQVKSWDRWGRPKKNIKKI